MPVLHLQIDIDSDVHPELHATLASMGKSVPQAERLRQLAAAGLIWEHLRIQVQPSAPAMPSVATGSGEVGAEASAETAVIPLRSPATPTLSTVPVGPREMAVRALPVLHDAIEDTEFRRSPSTTRKQDASNPSPGRRGGSLPMATRNKVPKVEAAALAGVPHFALQRSDALVADQESVRLVQGPTPTGSSPDIAEGTSDRDRDVVSPPVRKAGTRSRLLRMKEKGLFSNGPDH
jgi:hypothetical protein